MIWRIIEWLLRRQKVAPPLRFGATCCVPGCGRPGGEQWWPGFCSLREAEVPIAWMAVCDEHDVELNEVEVRFLFGSRYDKELAAYRWRRLPHGRA